MVFRTTCRLSSERRQNNLLRGKTVERSAVLFRSEHSLGSYFIPAVPDHEPPGPHHLLRVMQTAKRAVAAWLTEAALANPYS